MWYDNIPYLYECAPPQLAEPQTVLLHDEMAQAVTQGWCWGLKTT